MRPQTQRQAFGPTVAASRFLGARMGIKMKRKEATLSNQGLGVSMLCAVAWH